MKEDELRELIREILDEEIAEGFNDYPDATSRKKYFDTLLQNAVGYLHKVKQELGDADNAQYTTAVGRDTIKKIRMIQGDLDRIIKKVHSLM